MVENSFGGKHTIKKLETVADYLNFYTKALKNQPFKLKYFDGFAGTGDMRKQNDLPLLSGGKNIEIMEGSALRSLEIQRPFDEYFSSEISIGKTKKLKQAIAKHSHLRNRVKIRNGTIDHEIEHFCGALSQYDRAVVFLDPCGGQVNWKILKTIAKSEKVDLWYLFPSGLNVVRQLKQNGEVHPDAKQNIDALFGTQDWIHEFVKHREELDLFGVNEITYREIDADAVTRYMIKRMSTIFKGGVLSKWLPLGKGNAQWYSLIFACSNPNHAANNLAKRGAGHIVSKK